MTLRRLRACTAPRTVVDCGVDAGRRGSVTPGLFPLVRFVSFPHLVRRFRCALPCQAGLPTTYRGCLLSMVPFEDFRLPFMVH